MVRATSNIATSGPDDRSVSVVAEGPCDRIFRDWRSHGPSAVSKAEFEDAAFA
jgi:hypothetical protein